MSLIFCDGFDDGLGGYGKWDTWPAHAISSTGARNGSKLQFTDGWEMKKKLGADAHTTVTWGFAAKSGADPFGWNANSGTGGNIGSVWGDDGVTRHVSVYIAYNTGSSFVSAYRGLNNTGTLLGSASITSLSGDNWYFLECQVVLHDTTGSVVVKINGTTVLNLTNVDTKNGGTGSNIDMVSVAYYSGGFGGRSYHMDDFYLTNGAGSTNTGFLGDVAVETLYPDGNGSSSQFTGSDGNSTDNYQLVDEAAPSTTDYVQNGVNGQRDLYTYAALTRSTGTVYGVQASSYAQKADSGDRSLKNVTKSSAVTATSSALTLATTWQSKSNIFEADPNTASAWTVSTVNAAEFGIETSA